MAEFLLGLASFGFGSWLIYVAVFASDDDWMIGG